MSGTATFIVDTSCISVASSIAAMARSAATSNGPLVVVTGRAYADLADELGSDEAAARHLFHVATNSGHPIAVNLPTGTDTSRTIFISPRGWSEDRLAGWAAGRHAELEAAFGPATIVNEEDL